MGLWETLEQKLRRRQHSQYFSQTPNYSFYSDTKVMRIAGREFFRDMEKLGRWLKKQAKEMGLF